ncbi:MAG TPA: AbrB/MazE/SpoVT family DNA-binding domain-containing protein [Bacillota bacterium]|nr:AbrB/MazE/SpoVT family DNA-binding domain-containing protein [Bacillota bacterium]HOR87123.1 AbrB/MazE/SpoVT family DNA-binding domain-containing protein [Bacillota bacterium]HPL52853.1 AbrB/MazE/SpoVT family DNA-binding domain-containing protein [Bacillota bacterium]
MSTVKIQKWGNSHGIRLPKYVLDKANIKEGDTVEVALEGDRIIIFQTKKKLIDYSLNELFKNYDVSCKPDETDWGKPLGKEEW